MEAPYAAHPVQFPGQAPFFYYNPDPNSENRQHGHFTPHPHGLPMSAAGQDAVAIYTTHMYQRPSSSCSPVAYQQMPPHYAAQMMTPVQSPQPVYQKPTILVQQDSPYLYPIDTDCHAPATPPLSSSGSAISSPPSTADILPTPVNGCFGVQSFDGIKAGCEDEVFSEILAGEDWTRSTSPPLTPGKPFTIYYPSRITFRALPVVSTLGSAAWSRSSLGSIRSVWDFQTEF